MAKIESRRARRRILRTALPVLAALLVCAAVFAAVVLPKLNARKAGGEQAQVTAGPTAPSPTESSPVSAPTDEAPEDIPEPASPTAAPAPTSTPGSKPGDQNASDAATPVPEQSTEDRSLILVTAEFEGALSAVRGSCAVRFINNTAGVMYAAYFEMGSLSVKIATVNGEAVRYSEDLPGVLMIPFANELKPGEALDLFFEFEGSLDSEFIVPRPAYDSAYDAVCFVSSYRELSFSSGETSVQNQGGLFVYKVTAERVSAAILVSA